MTTLPTNSRSALRSQSAILLRRIWCPVIATVATLLVSQAAIADSRPIVQGQQLDQPDTVQSFPVGGRPTGLSFDGENIWVCSGSSNIVTKLRASDGAQLGAFDVGKPAVNSGFDGTYIWLSMYDSDYLTRIKASDGSLQGTFTVGYTVRYEAVNAMLLNEFLKAHKKVETQTIEIADLKATVAEVKAALQAQAAQLQKVSERLEASRLAPTVVANN